MTDMSALSAEQLAEKVRMGMHSPGVWQELLSELVRRASERDQAVRERDEREAMVNLLKVTEDSELKAERKRADRLAAAIEKAITGCEGEIVGEALRELTAVWRQERIAK